MAPWRLTIARIRRDRWTMGSLIVVTIVMVLSFAGGPIASRILGHNGFDQLPYAANITQKPVGPLSVVPALNYSAGMLASGELAPPPKGTPKTLLVFGADGPVGRDEFIRVLDGGKTSLEIAIGGALIALLIGLPLGAIGGYIGGISDAIVSRITDTIMAFPLMLFLVFASVQLDSHIRGIGISWWLPDGVIAEALLIGVFTSFYPTRLIRAQLFQLREAEFVEAAEMVGASRWRTLRSHLLPHLVPTHPRLECGRGRDEHPARDRPQLHRRRRAAVDADVGIAASTTWGTFFSAADLQQPSSPPGRRSFPTVGGPHHGASR